MAIDGSKYSQWVSKQYGGQTKENPADVWLGVNLPAETKIRGIAIAGDEREMMPVQKDFKVFIRNNTELAELKDLTIEPDSTVKNSYTVNFDKEQSADGIMIYFDKEDLPKSELPEQDGLVRIKELLMITPEGEKSVAELFYD
jgi:hypothetical protein